MARARKIREPVGIVERLAQEVTGMIELTVDGLGGLKGQRGQLWPAVS